MEFLCNEVYYGMLGLKIEYATLHLQGHSKEFGMLRSQGGEEY